MQILQITDTHLYGSASGRLRGVETDSSLHATLDDAFSRAPNYEAVLVTGDLVQDDKSGYLRFRSFFGNLVKPMGAELTGDPFKICGAHTIGDWTFVMLDSYDPGHVGGRLTKNELARLDAALTAAPKHVMVCLHHHPIAMGSRWLDSVGLAQPEDFWNIIDAHTNVRAVVWGHVHQAFDGDRGAVRLFATPSTGAQFLPKSDRYAVDSAPPAYRSFDLHADGRIDSQVHWVESTQLRQTAS
jgi:3',5'-cyclic-AMP phosphodiesterase